MKNIKIKKLEKSLTFDFDGVFIPLNKEYKINSQKYKDLKLMEGAKEGIEILRNEFEIFVQSSRTNPNISADYIHHIGMIWSFLKENGIDINRNNITPYKPISFRYIDDMGYVFTTWKRLIHDIENMRGNE